MERKGWIEVGRWISREVPVLGTPCLVAVSAAYPRTRPRTLLGPRGLLCRLETELPIRHDKGAPENPIRLHYAQTTLRQRAAFTASLTTLTGTPQFGFIVPGSWRLHSTAPEESSNMIGLHLGRQRYRFSEYLLELQRASRGMRGAKACLALGRSDGRDRLGVLDPIKRRERNPCTLIQGLGCAEQLRCSFILTNASGDLRQPRQSVRTSLSPRAV